MRARHELHAVGRRRPSGGEAVGRLGERPDPPWSASAGGTRGRGPVLGLGRDDEGLARTGADRLEGQLVAGQHGMGRKTMSKSAGVVASCSFSSQEPDGMNAALYWFQAVCDSVCVMPLVPGRRKSFSTIW